MLIARSEAEFFPLALCFAHLIIPWSHVPVYSNEDPVSLRNGKMKVKVAQSCPTLCDPMDCSPPGSSVHGISQARVLELGAIAFSNQVALMIKNLSANAVDARDAGLIPGSGRYPGVGNGNWVQYSCLENPMDRGSWWATAHGAAKSQTWLSTKVC